MTIHSTSIFTEKRLKSEWKLTFVKREETAHPTFFKRVTHGNWLIQQFLLTFAVLLLFTSDATAKRTCENTISVDKSFRLRSLRYSQTLNHHGSPQIASVICVTFINWRGDWKKALSGVWLTTRFSFPIALYLLVKQNENLSLHQVSLRALFRAPLHL